MYTLSDYYDDVETFNALANNLTNVTPAKMIAQANVLQEEVQELKDGLNNEDLEEILDGTVDVIYVAFGMLQMLRSLGYDTERAMEKTARNNLTKFPTSINTVVESVDDYSENGTEITWEYNKVYDKYVLKDTKGKIRKPLGYVKNNLKDCLPKE